MQMDEHIYGQPSEKRVFLEFYDFFAVAGTSVRKVGVGYVAVRSFILKLRTSKERAVPNDRLLDCHFLWAYLIPNPNGGSGNFFQQ